MNPVNGLRRHPREPIAGRVRITWAPAGGLTQYVLCNAVDISESGLRINSTEALTVGQYVHLQMESVGLRGAASVRSCNRNSVRHEIGLEFSSGVKWKKRVQPPTSPAA
jgi:hypothetical protein